MRERRVLDVVVDQGVQRDLNEQLQIEFAQQQKRITRAFRTAVRVPQHSHQRAQISGRAKRLDELGGLLLLRRRPLRRCHRPGLPASRAGSRAWLLSHPRDDGEPCTRSGRPAVRYGWRGRRSDTSASN